MFWSIQEQTLFYFCWFSMFSKIHCLPCGVFWCFFALSYLDCLCYLSSMPTSTLWCFQLIVQARVECPTLLFFPDFIAYLVVSFGGCPCWVTSPNLCFLMVIRALYVNSFTYIAVFLVSLCYIAYWCVLSPGYLVYLVFSCIPCVFW